MAGCSRGGEGWGTGERTGGRCGTENGGGLPCSTGPLLEGRGVISLKLLWERDRRLGGKGGEGGKQTMSDVLMTRRPVPRHRWNDSQVVRRAAMNHPSSILQNAPSVSQSLRLSSAALAAGKNGNTKLRRNCHSVTNSAGKFICHILCFPSLIGV